jgi:hypothetical protein
MANLHEGSLDRLRAAGILPAITDENGRFIAFVKADILAFVASGGTHRLKPGRKPYKATKEAK